MNIVDDLLVEGAETFTVTLSAPAGAELSRAVAVVTIEDDDLPVLSVLDVSVLGKRRKSGFHAESGPGIHSSGPRTVCDRRRHGDGRRGLSAGFG